MECATETYFMDGRSQIGCRARVAGRGPSPRPLTIFKPPGRAAKPDWSYSPRVSFPIREFPTEPLHPCDLGFPPYTRAVSILGRRESDDASIRRRFPARRRDRAPYARKQIGRRDFSRRPISKQLESLFRTVNDSPISRGSRPADSPAISKAALRIRPTLTGATGRRPRQVDCPPAVRKAPCRRATPERLGGYGSKTSSPSAFRRRTRE